jgi:trimeric autotransporter adhesin
MKAHRYVLLSASLVLLASCRLGPVSGALPIKAPPTKVTVPRTTTTRPRTAASTTTSSSTPTPPNTTTTAKPTPTTIATTTTTTPAFPATSVSVDTANPSASDAGPGTATTPFKTIQRAIDVAEANNAHGVATTINVQPGVYREELEFEPQAQTTAAPIVLQGPPTDDAIVSAADVWTGWTSTAGGLYSHQWPYQWGLAPIPSGWEDAGVTPIVQRHETLFVNGVLLREVLSMADLQASSDGAFFVSEPDQTVYIKPSPGVDMSTALVEVGVRPRVLLGDSQNNLTVRNLQFRGATTAFAPAGILVNPHNVVLDQDTFSWNNWTGLEVDGGVNVTVSNSHFNHNGAMGLSGQKNQNLTLDNDENSYNNWRGAWGGMTLWENGMKLSSSDGLVIDNYVAIGNQAPGLWLDTDNRNVTIENSTLENNDVDGVLLEANQGPITVQNNTICGNGRAGIFDGRSNNVSVTGNRSFDNSSAQLVFSGAPLSRSVTNWETGVTTVVQSQGWTVRGNTFAGSGTGQLVIGGWGVTAPAWALMAGTMVSQNNTFFQSGASQPFWIPGTNQFGNMANWIAASGESGSTFSSGPSGLTCG